MLDLVKYIRDVPNFPKPGIIFKDITPLLRSAVALRQTAEMLAKPFGDGKIDLVAGIESRGFIFGALVAKYLSAGFVPIRKAGKLPHTTINQSYDLEYGSSTVEVHADAVEKGQRVLVVDDLLATGGTAAAACALVRKLGGEVAGVSFVVELSFLDGRKRLGGYDVRSLIQVAAE
jgi:adenine phosphoribosyltransferase